MNTNQIRKSFEEAIGVNPKKLELIRGIVYATTPQGKTYFATPSSAGNISAHAWRLEYA